MTCTYSNPILSIPLSTDLTAGSTYTFTLTKFTNPRTYTPSGSFTVATKISTFDVSSSSATGITNSQPNTINTLSITVTNPTQSYMDSTQTIKFSFATTNYLVSTDYIIILFPTQYTYTGTAGVMVACSPYNCTPDSSNPLSVKVTPGVQTFSSISSFNLSIMNFKSPTVSTSDYFLVYSYQADSTPIDQINTALPAAQASFYLSCTLPCQTCSSTNASVCLSCYSSPINLNVFYSNGSCYTTCPNTTYTSGFTCLACVSPCKTCTSLTTCTSCVSTFFYYTTNSSCLS